MTQEACEGKAGRIEAQVEGRSWTLERPADLESLWEAMCARSAGSPGLGGVPGFDGGDERLPYWVELWPAAVLLARWLHRQGEGLRGRTCLDAGCGLGLSALVAASFGARVLAFDYEAEALRFARKNAALNRALLRGGTEPLFALFGCTASFGPAHTSHEPQLPPNATSSPK